MRLQHMRAGFRVAGVIAPALAARVGARLFYTPRRHPPFKWEAALLSEAQSFTHESREGRIRVMSWGEGPTVLLVHGWEGRGTQLGKFVKPLCEAGFRVVSFDGPAHGESSGTRTTLPRFATVAVELCNRLGPIHGIIGHSFGAAAASIALKSGVDVKRAVFISPPYSFENVLKRYAAFLSMPPKVLDKMHLLMRNLHQCPAVSLSFESIGPRLNLPILIVHDTDDQYVPYSDGIEVARSCPHAQLIATSKLGHIRVLLNRTVVCDTVNYLNDGEVTLPIVDTIRADPALSTNAG